MAESFDVSKGLQEGQDAASTMFANIRKTMALNALTKIYGPIAGAPDEAVKMQEYGQREKLNPIAVDQAGASLKSTQLENTGKEQTNSLNAALNPLKVQQQTETVREQPLTFAAEQKQAGATLDSTRANTARANIAAQSDKVALSEQQNAIAGRVVNGLISVRDTGGDVNAAFGTLSPELVKMGIIDPKRAGVIAQAIKLKPEYLDQLSASLGYGAGAKGMTQVPASDDPRVMVSVPTSSLPKAQPGVQYTVNRHTGAVEAHTVEGTPQDLKQQAAVRTVNQEIGKAQLAFANNEIRFSQAQNNLDQAMNYSGGAGMVTGLTSWVPGSQAHNLKAALNSVQSDIVTNVIQTFKESTQKGQASGVGRVMQAEIKLWQDAYAATEASQSPTILRANLGRLKTVTTQLQQANRNYNKTVYGLDPPPLNASVGALPGGFKYLGPKK